jgi:pyrroloquinoline-quinone synthase
MNDRFHAEAFWAEMQERISKFDLLKHPFYQAWSAGELRREDLREYAADYYPQVAAFPTYLSALHSRLEDSETRRAVLRNLAEEEIRGRAHSELWLDFAEGMGAARGEIKGRLPLAEVADLVDGFRQLSQSGTTAECVAAFYAYESQVPRIAEAKLCGLEKHYAADKKTTGYFRLHRTADVQHAGVWRELLDRALEERPEDSEAALVAAERSVAALWKALDGIERKRARVAA